ncbi:MAG: hypothetical protein EOM12_15915 [Verrucomicrobiae bacterium]|nr:hypothetical protein [Verrucomicrobiae bacterium]
MTFSATETYRDIDMDNGALSPLLNATVNSAIFTLFILALPAQNRKAALLVFVIGLLLLVNTAFFPSTRYRLPMIALMCAGIPGLYYCRKISHNLIGLGVAMALILFGTYFVGRVFDRSSWQALRALQTAEKLAINEDHDGADRFFRTAIAAKPILHALSRYGEFLLFKQHDSATARIYLNRAIAFNPDFPDPHFHLAFLLKDINEYERAYSFYSSYIHLRDRLNYLDGYDFAMLFEALYFCSVYQSSQSGVTPMNDFFARLEMLITIADTHQYKYNSDVLQNIEKMRRIRIMRYEDT